MKGKMSGDEWFRQLARERSGKPEDLTAPSRLKARAYSALIARQQESGQLLDLPACKQNGRPLCVFEELVRISPAGRAAKSAFPCRFCHARLLAENFENAPIWWPHCPYVRFQNR